MSAARLKLVVVLCAVFGMGVGVGALLLEWQNRTRLKHELGPAVSSSQTEKYHLEGEVFLQIRSGEVQRAPACTVYLFNSYSQRGREWDKIMVAFLESASQGKMNHKDLIEVIQFAPGHLYEQKFSPPGKAVSSIFEDREFTTNCDSTGKFNLNIPAGDYIVVATGRAGFNEAVWQKLVTIPNGQSVSLGDPIYSYFDEPH